MRKISVEIIINHIFQNERFYFMRERIYKIILGSDKIRMCTLQKQLDINSIPEELTMNIHITQLFEMLTYQEQMILKSCSILGDSFPRKMLEHVLTLDYYSLLAPGMYHIETEFSVGVTNFYWLKQRPSHIWKWCKSYQFWARKKCKGRLGVWWEDSNWNRDSNCDFFFWLIYLYSIKVANFLHFLQLIRKGYIYRIAILITV